MRGFNRVLFVCAFILGNGGTVRCATPEEEYAKAAVEVAIAVEKAKQAKLTAQKSVVSEVTTNRPFQPKPSGTMPLTGVPVAGSTAIPQPTEFRGLGQYRAPTYTLVPSAGPLGTTRGCTTSG